MNANKYGENLNWFLNELSVSELDHIEGGELEIVGDDNCGCCTLPIPELAGVALAKIKQHEQTIKALKTHINGLRETITSVRADEIAKFINFIINDDPKNESHKPWLLCMSDVYGQQN